MNERRDDTTKPRDESRREPGRYYYDDATGYEVFDPQKNDDGDADEATDESGRPGDGESDAPAGG